MGKTPLQFLRHEASGKSGTKRGLQLSERMGFVSRFRLRIFLRNLGNFATLFVGIAFASLLLLFGLAILPTMTHYADNLETSLVAERQYTLKAPLELEGTAEEREQWSALERLQSVDARSSPPPRMPMTSLTTRPMRRRRSRCCDRISVCREPDRSAGRACQGPGQERCALRAP